MCECSFIGPVTPGPDATNSLHWRRKPRGRTRDDAAPCVLLSYAIACTVWVIECKGWNAFAQTTTFSRYFATVYFTLYSRVTNRKWMDPLGTLEAKRSARLIASKRRVNFRAVDIRTPFSAAPGCSSSWIDRILLLLRGRSGVIWTGSWKLEDEERFYSLFLLSMYIYIYTIADVSGLKERYESCRFENKNRRNRRSKFYFHR